MTQTVLRIGGKKRKQEQLFLVGTDGRGNVGAVLLIQRVVDDGTVLQSHLGLDTNNHRFQGRQVHLTEFINSQRRKTVYLASLWVNIGHGVFPPVLIKGLLLLALQGL